MDAFKLTSPQGAICLDTLSAKWSPVLTIKTALLSLQSLLDAPEPSDPQDAEVAQMMLSTPQLFQARAREWAVRYAGAPASMVGGPGGPANRPVVVAEAKKEYGGYEENVVERFASMGFSVGMVVRALGVVGVRKRGGMTEEEAGRVVELLLS